MITGKAKIKRQAPVALTQAFIDDRFDDGIAYQPT